MKDIQPGDRVTANGKIGRVAYVHGSSCTVSLDEDPTSGLTFEADELTFVGRVLGTYDAPKAELPIDEVIVDAEIISAQDWWIVGRAIVVGSALEKRAPKFAPGSPVRHEAGFLRRMWMR